MLNNIAITVSVIIHFLKLSTLHIINDSHALKDRHSTQSTLYGHVGAIISLHAVTKSKCTALLKVANDILFYKNQKHVTFLVLLGLSYVFDTADHSILITCLLTHFGICDTSPGSNNISLAEPNPFPSVVQIHSTLPLNTAFPLP